MKSQQHPQVPPVTPPKHCRARASWRRAAVWWRAALGSRVTPTTLMVTPWVFHGASSRSLVCKVGGYHLPRQFVLRLTQRPVHEVPARPLARAGCPRSRQDGGLLQPRSSREDRSRFLRKQEVERDHPPLAPLIGAQPPVGRGLGAPGSGPGTSRAVSPSSVPLWPEPRESRVPQPGHRGKEVLCVPLVSRPTLQLSRARPHGPALPAPLISSPEELGGHLVL